MSLPVAFYLHHLETGGLERVVLNLLQHLPRERVRPALVLQERRGALLTQVPDDVPILDLDGRRNLLAARRLARRLEELDARVVHSATRWTNYAAIRAVGRAGGRAGGRMERPPVLWIGDHTPPRAAFEEVGHRRLHRAAMRRLYPRAAGLVVPNPAIGDELREVADLPDLPVRFLPNPVFRADQVVGDEPREDDLVVAAGRLVPLKRFDLALRALARLEGVRFVLLGDGPERGGLEALAEELGLAGRVTFAGAVPDPTTWFRRAAAVLLTSQREGAPNVLVEAMACGAPVVSVDCPLGPRMLTDGGRDGVLVEQDDPASIAAALGALLGDPERRMELAARGRARAAAFEVRAAAGAYADLFAGSA